MAKRPSKRPQIFTIGYLGHDLETYVEELRSNRIRLLCDVRRNPISRKKGFSKNKLRTAVENAGIEYLHFPELGIPPEERRAAKSPTDRKRMFGRYRKHTIGRERDAIERIAQLASERGRIALTCVEEDAHDCHRSIVAEEAARSAKIEKPIVHL